MRTETGQTTVERGSDDPFAAPSHRRRRRVLTVLRAAAGPLTVTEVAIGLSRRGDGADGARGEDLERVRLTLHHRHLPKLAATGLVEYDAAGKTVALSGAAPAAVADDEPEIA